MNLDLALCKKILDEGPQIVHDNGLTPDHFVGDGTKTFKFILNHFSTHGVMPDTSTIQSAVGVVLPDPPEPTSYYLEQVMKRRMGNLLGDHINDAIQHLKQGHPEKVVDVAKTIISTGQSFGHRRAYEDLRHTVKDRWEAYREVAEQFGAIDGLCTPWKELDEATRGMHKGELWVAVAKLKIGKTWMLMLFLERIWSAGYRPLLVSMEMPIKTVSRRFDALHTCLPYGDFRAGTLGDFLEKKYMDTLVEFQKKHEIWIAGNGRIKTPADVEVLCQELNPDVVLIDGMYLMSPSRGRVGSKYERVSMVVDELQPLAHKMNLPIMATTQFNRSLRKKTGGDATESIGYAYEIAQNADVLIGMFSNDDLRASRRMLVTLMEHREGEDLNMLVRWDLDEMNFDFIGTVDAEELEELQSGKSNEDKMNKAANQITF